MNRMHERGFSLIELLLVLTIMGIIIGISIPFYRRYVAQTELKNVSQDLYTQFVTAQNNALNGVVPKDGSSNQRYYWVVHIQRVSGVWEYEVGACPLKTMPPATQTEYDNQFSFSFCGVEAYRNFEFPERFSINHAYLSGSNEAAAIYFEPITGQAKVYSLSGARLDNATSTNAIDLTIQSTDYTQTTVTITVNHQGKIQLSS